jgi:hypothetical protein
MLDPSLQLDAKVTAAFRLAHQFIRDNPPTVRRDLNGDGDRAV